MIAFAKIGRGGKVDNRQVHRDAAEHRKRPLSGECAALPGKAPEIAVGVTQVEHAHPHRPFGGEGGVIADAVACADFPHLKKLRSEEHTSELQSLMRISYAVFCLKKQN